MVPMRGRPKWIVGTAACVAALLLTIAGWAGEPTLAGDTETPAPGGNHPELDRLIERKLDRLFDHLQGVLQDLPRYALPELTEDGDIVIRRLPRRPEGWSRIPKDPDEMVDL